MIAKMTKYSFILLKGDEEGFLQKVRENGLVDITREAKPVDERSAALLAEAGRRKAVIPEAQAELQAASSRLEAARKEAEAVKPWGAFTEADLARLDEAGLQLHWYSMQKKRFDESWKESWPIEEISSDDKTISFVAVTPKGEDNPLPVKEIPAPKGDYAAARQHIAELEQEQKEAQAKLEALQAESDKIEAEYQKALSELDLYLAGVAAVPAADGALSTFVGYAPAESDEAVTATLDASGVFYLKEAAVTEDNPPISFRNNRFVKMFEVLTDMYGRPAYDGFDPTPFISVFFLLFFAFCMGDAGYGLILIAIGLALKKVKGFSDLSPLVVTLGIGTFVIGFLFHTFFSIDISTWSIFAPIKKIFLPSKIAGYDGTMVLSLIVGVLHISLAMIVKTIKETSHKGFLGSLGTWGWTLLIVGGVAVGAAFLAGVLDAALTKWIIIGIGSLSAIGIFLLNDIHRNPFVNIGSGLWDTYNMASGLLGDVLSYLRLYALGLAGSMLGMAFNSIGSMILGDGHNVFLWILFLLIVIVGHTLNIAMAALGAFVHPLRLNFLEFFKNSGYEAAGRKYSPLK